MQFLFLARVVDTAKKFFCFCQFVYDRLILSRNCAFYVFNMHSTIDPRRLKLKTGVRRKRTTRNRNSLLRGAVVGDRNQQLHIARQSNGPIPKRILYEVIATIRIHPEIVLRWLMCDCGSVLHIVTG